MNQDLKNLIPKYNEPNYPFLFRIARTLYTLLTGFRGEFFLYSLLGRFGKLRAAGRFKYFDNVIYVPLTVPETLFVNDFSLFQGLREMNFAIHINRLFREFILIDCGAYYGQVSMRIAKLCPGLTRVIIVDPSYENCEYSRANLELTGKLFNIIHAAVSDFRGRAELIFPEGPNVPDSAYIKPSDKGEITVIRLDDLPNTVGIDFSRQNLAIKIDVEGEEIAAVAGAEKIIREAAGVCFFIELHPGVLKRKGKTAEALLRSVDAIRNTEWYVADKPDLKLSLNSATSIFDQIGEERVCDVIGVAI